MLFSIILVLENYQQVKTRIMLVAYLFKLYYWTILIISSQIDFMQSILQFMLGFICLNDAQ